MPQPRTDVRAPGGGKKGETSSRNKVNLLVALACFSCCQLLVPWRFQRASVKEKDVALPSAVVFASLLVLLLVWTLVDPVRWERFERHDQTWNTYGKCVLGDGKVGKVMMACDIALLAALLLSTGWQAFRARNISSEFSESTYLGIAVFSWMQLAVVGTPFFFPCGGA